MNWVAAAASSISAAPDRNGYTRAALGILGRNKQYVSYAEAAAKQKYQHELGTALSLAASGTCVQEGWLFQREVAFQVADLSVDLDRCRKQYLLVRE
jgi:hypothetical protein